MFQNRFFFAVFAMVLSFSLAFVCPISLPAADSQVIYSTDFETGVGSEWSSVRTDVTPSGRKFFGRFGNQTVTLTLVGLPAHASLGISFDLYIINSWDGNDPTWGPDIWQAEVVGDRLLKRTTFAWPSSDARQAYPASYPGGTTYPSGTRAAEKNTLGYVYAGFSMDSVYQMTFPIAHAADAVAFQFSAAGLQNIGDESWGLDNVMVTVDGVPYYANDFEGDIGTEWSITTAEAAPAGSQHFYGRFSNDRVLLSLTDLLPHTNATVSFDLYVIQTWDGSTGGEVGPDVWDLSTPGHPSLIHTTFSNNDGRNGTMRFDQAYPDSYPGPMHPPQANATAKNSLGYTFTWIEPAVTLPVDSTYHLVKDFSHQEDTLQLAFSASVLQDPDDESWGLDNVVVTVEGVPAPQILSVAPAPGQSMLIFWEYPTSNDTSFVVERRDSNFCAWQPLDTVPANTTIYTDAKLPWSDQISYRVAATSVAGTSDWVESLIVSHPAIPRWQLMLFRPIGVDDGMWVSLRPCDTRFDPNFGTAVIVHGWTSKIPSAPADCWSIDEVVNGWPLDLARKINQRFSGAINVLMWEWAPEACTLRYIMDGGINTQAESLTKALKQTFPQGYDEPIHLIGHSYGCHVATVCAGFLGQASPAEGPLIRPNQLTLFDPPEIVGGIGDLDRNVPILRSRDVYVELYDGCFNEGIHGVNLWVDVPVVRIFPQCHIIQTWYRDTISSVEEPVLYQIEQGITTRIDGTVGFGTSALLFGQASRPTAKVCEGGATQMYGYWFDGPISGLSFYRSEQCTELIPPQPQVNQDLTTGRFSVACDCGYVSSTELFLGSSTSSVGGAGGQVAELAANYVLELDIPTTWDYVSFEYSFTATLTTAALEATATSVDSSYQLFRVFSDVVPADRYQETGVLGIRPTQGQLATFLFTLRSQEPGVRIYLRNLTFWSNPTQVEVPVTFQRSDTNGDGTVDVSDAIATLGCLFLGTPCPSCLDVSDANDDGASDLSDVIFTLSWLFLGTAAPPAPGPTRSGLDPTRDLLPCNP